VIFPKIREGAKSVGRSFEDIIKVIEMDVSIDEDYHKALDSLKCFKPNLVPNIFRSSEYDPRKLEEMGNKVSDDEIPKAFVVGTSFEEITKRIEASLRAGFDHVYVSSNSPNEERFLDEFGKKVIPYFVEMFRN
jgi:alkanesulfonate monooxygenase SsuD/methylene tetrahydromethanopterin reductase-like flavin-dependent oxidoreductase (luciferase family)